jgi:hypothetical protein
MYSAVFEVQIIWWLPFSFLKSSFSFFDDVLIFQNQMNFFYDMYFLLVVIIQNKVKKKTKFKNSFLIFLKK